MRLIYIFFWFWHLFLPFFFAFGTFWNCCYFFCLPLVLSFEHIFFFIVKLFSSCTFLHFWYFLEFDKFFILLVLFEIGTFLWSFICRSTKYFKILLHEKCGNTFDTFLNFVYFFNYVSTFLYFWYFVLFPFSTLWNCCYFLPSWVSKAFKFFWNVMRNIWILKKHCFMDKVPKIDTISKSKTSEFPKSNKIIYTRHFLSSHEWDINSMFMSLCYKDIWILKFTKTLFLYLLSLEVPNFVKVPDISPLFFISLRNSDWFLFFFSSWIFKFHKI